jgi:hypothetical protein
VDLDEHARGADKLIGFPVYSENFEACLLAAKHRERMQIWTATRSTKERFGRQEFGRQINPRNHKDFERLSPNGRF